MMLANRWWLFLGVCVYNDTAAYLSSSRLSIWRADAGDLDLKYTHSHTVLIKQHCNPPRILSLCSSHTCTTHTHTHFTYRIVNVRYLENGTPEHGQKQRKSLGEIYNSKLQQTYLLVVHYCLDCRCCFHCCCLLRPPSLLFVWLTLGLPRRCCCPAYRDRNRGKVSTLRLSLVLAMDWRGCGARSMRVRS